MTSQKREELIFIEDLLCFQNSTMHFLTSLSHLVKVTAT